MSDNQSFHKRSHLSEEAVSQAVANEAREIVWDAAGADAAGKSIKGQLRLAARALGYRDGDWRIRAAWYGEASTWSAAAMERLRGQYENLRERRARRAADAEAKKQDDYEILSKRLSSIEEFFADIDPDVRREILSLVGRPQVAGCGEDQAPRAPLGAVAREERSDQ